jgi:hypothetical protein
MNSNTGAWNGSPGQNGMPTGGWNNTDFGYKNYMSRLPEVYTGHPNRIERYNQYEMMDVDAEINACLDIIAEFSTQTNQHNKTPFNLEYKDDPTNHEVNILKQQLQQWCKLNEFDTRAFKIFRNVIKYGDQVFVRDPENFKLYWVDMVKVIKVIVNESEGKKPEQYVVKDLNINLQNLSVAQKTNTDFAANPATGLGGTGGGTNTPYTVPAMPYNTSGSRFTLGQSEAAVDAKHIVHLSLTEGLDRFWPFGQSILENVFKVYKQKELLEDAVLIYRVQRAPERRMFKIDVGNMPSHLAMAFVERIKNEIHQRRIPSVYGGQCFAMDTMVPLLDGRTLSISDIADEFNQGKENWIYSCDPVTGKMVPGIVSWAGVTRKDSEVLELTLDNGKKIICTGDHKFPIQGKGFVEAKDIIINEDSLFSFNTRMHGINCDGKDNIDTDSQYHQLYDHSVKDWVYTHRNVASFMKSTGQHKEFTYSENLKDAVKNTIHHVDYNKFNNTPNNLIFMNYKDHFLYHSNESKSFFNLLSEEEKTRRIKKAKDTYNKKSDEFKEKSHEKRSNASTKNWVNIKKDSNRYAKVKAQLLNNLSTQMSKPFPNQKLAFNQEMFDILVSIVTNHKADKETTLSLLTNDQHFMMIYQQLNEFKSGHSRLVLDRFTKDTLQKLLSAYGYKSWKSFINKYGNGIKRPSKKLIWSPKMLKYVVDIIKATGKSNAKDVLPLIQQHSEFMNEFKTLNSNIKGNADSSKFTVNTLGVLIADNGYKNWSDFKKKIELFNHKVVSIRVLPQKIDVGTITVDGNEKYHNFHTFALEAGVYTKNSIVDATYNPLSMNEDYFFPVTADGRGSSVEMLAGGQNLGEIDDLRYFNNRLARGLRVPSSYLPTGPDDSDRVMNDGKVGTALIQEYRFNQYCERLQNYMSIKLDEEFKLFLRWRGFNIDSGLFKLTFNPPQNFAAYRQSELDKDRVATFQTVEALPYISKRFAMQRFLGLSEDEITKNEKLWEEENSKEKLDEPKGKDLRSIGVSTSDIESDMSTAEELGGEAEGGEPPPEVAGPVGGGAETSGAPAAPAGGAAGAPAGVPAPPAL